jgi:integrase
MKRKFQRLDRDGIRALQPGQRLAEGGIIAVRLANGDIRWSVQFRIERQKIHRVIGLASEGVERQNCTAFIEKARTETREGRLALPHGRKVVMTLATAAPLYLERLEEGDGRNIERKRRQLRLHLVPFFGTMPLGAISEFTIGKYRKARERAGASPATTNRELATLNHLLHRAVDWKWLHACPCRIRMAKEERPAVRVLSDVEAKALLQAALADSDPDLFTFTAIGLLTAMRHSEILAARFDEIDFDKLRVFVARAKAGAREQPLPRGLADLLRREREMAPDPRGWIFPSRRPELAAPGDPGHRTRIGRSFARAVAAAGLDPQRVTPHVLRHTAITNMIKAGVDLPTIQGVSGHKTIAMVLRYYTLHGKHVDAAVSTLDRLLLAPNVPGMSHAPETGSLGPLQDSSQVTVVPAKKG